MVGLQTLIVVMLIWIYNEPKIEKRDMAMAIAGFCVYLFVVFQGEVYLNLSTICFTFHLFIHANTISHHISLATSKRQY